MNPREPGCALALAGSTITHPSIHAQTGLQTPVTKEAMSTGLVTEEPGPARLAGAFSFHWVAAERVLVLAETRALTVHAVFARRTHPLPAVWAAKPGLTQAAAVDVEAASAVSAVTHTFTVLTVGACSTLLITPATREAFGTFAQSSFRVTFAAVVADALLSTV